MSARRALHPWLAAACLWWMLGASGSASGDAMVGVGQAEFALPPQVPLAGYSKRGGHPSTGSHDPVGARALVLRDARSMLVFVSCDLLVIDEALYARAARALREIGVPSESVLLLSATHTHSGPGAYGRKFVEKISMGHFDPRVRDAIVAAIASSVTQAMAGMDRALIASTAIRVPGVAQNRVQEGGVVDDELAIIAWYHPDQSAPEALMLGFAAHPTTLGASNLQLSADYPGALRRRIESGLPGTTAIFIAGASGDQAPVKTGEGFERAEWLGTLLAERALAVVPDLRPQPVTRLAATVAQIPLERARVRLSQQVSLPGWLGRRLVDDDATVTIARVNHVAFFGVPCDYSADLGADLKRAAAAEDFTPVLVGFANDYIGYCMSEQVYASDAYEALMAFNGPRTGVQITDRLRAMLQEFGHATQ